MSDWAIDREYLRYQYGDAEKLRVRQESHARYSENPGDFFEWVLSHADLRPGLVVVDIGCGPGAYHPLLCRQGVRVIGLDFSWGMVREARRGAEERRLEVWVAQADAQALPLPDVCCDRVMANHMLYHVPDQLRALREMRRVLRPDGRVILATNAADTNERLARLHAEAAQSLGYRVTKAMSARFTLDDLPLVRKVFPNARVYVREDAFLFPDVDSALRYYASGMIDRIEELPADGSHRPRLLALMEERIREIIAREGIFRVPKSAGCFVAEV
ncbi:MAG TPA: methyltransferase domain-containing protein [Caldilineae bacterium]|nr:methyltransferase domain-containing protein [Caldilineae bacterium]